METEELIKEIAPVIEKAIKEEVTAIKTENAETLKAMETELKELKMNSKRMLKNDDEASQKMKMEVISKTFKEIAWLAQVSEEQFKSIFEANFKVNDFNSEWTATEWAELVFTQFSNDVLNVMKQYKLVNELNIYPLTWNELKIPKSVNNITTAWIAEGADITKSKLGSSFVTINLYKAATLVPFTEELLKDNMTTPKYYDLVVRMIGESQGAFLENEVLNGTDATKIEWVLVNSAVKVWTWTVTTLNAMTFAQVDDLITDTDALIWAEFETKPDNAVVVMSKYVLNKLKRLKLTTGAYGYPDLRTANPMLLGKYRVLVSHKAPMQNAAADIAWATIMVMWDFKSFFGLAISENLTLTRGFADWDFQADLQSVKARRRMGWKCLYGEAFAKIKTAAWS